MENVLKPFETKQKISTLVSQKPRFIYFSSWEPLPFSLPALRRLRTWKVHKRNSDFL